MLSHALRAAAGNQGASTDGIQYIGQTSGNSGTNTLTLAVPTGTKAGDLLVAFGYAASDGTLWSATGSWTITNPTTTTPPRFTVFYTFASSITSFTFSQPEATSDIGITLMSFRNAEIDVIGSLATAANPLVLPSVTASFNNSLQLLVAGGNTDYPSATPSGFTELYLNTSITQPDWGVYYKENIASGATGNVSVSMSGSSNITGAQVILKNTPSTPPAIEYIGTSNAVQANGASVVCSVPSGALVGDLLVAFSSQTGSTTTYTMTPPAGWNETLDSNGRWCGYLASYDGTTANYTFTKSSSLADPAVVILAFRNAIFDIQGELSVGASSPVAPSITLTNNNNTVVACFCTGAQAASYTTPSGYTEVADLALGLAVSYKSGVASGATGTVTSTASLGSTSRGFLVGLRNRTGNELRVIGSTTFSSAVATTDLTMTKPTGTEAGDLMLAVLSKDAGSSTYTQPTDWVELEDTGATNRSFMVSYKIAGASEPSDYTFINSATGNNKAGFIITFRNASYDATAGDTRNLTDIAPARTPSVANSWWIIVGRDDTDQTAISYPNTINIVTMTLANRPSLAVAYRQLTSAGVSTGTVDGNWSGGDNYPISFSMILNQI